MKKNILIFIAIIFYNIQVCYANPMNDSIPPIQIQYDVINSKDFRNETDALHNLTDISIRALCDWIQELIGSERKSYIFYKEPLWIKSKSICTKASINAEVPLSEQNEDFESRIVSFETEELFSNFPMYEGVDTKNLLLKGCNLLQVQIEMDGFYRIKISIKAIIPVFSQDITKYNFYTTYFNYVYTLDLLDNDHSLHKRHYLVDKVKKDIQDFYINLYLEQQLQKSPRSFLQNFKWKLMWIKCVYSLTEHRYSESDLPTSINELFDLR
ncbi:MAG: hypothetical protein J1F20_07235 [Muribaculaceae bacterium]|nr:hypothetical protein [Muribaculaceae bacterium]